VIRQIVIDDVANEVGGFINSGVRVLTHVQKNLSKNIRIVGASAAAEPIQAHPVSDSNRYANAYV
jgi:hypothetical protein